MNRHRKTNAIEVAVGRSRCSMDKQMSLSAASYRCFGFSLLLKLMLVISVVGLWPFCQTWTDLSAVIADNTTLPNPFSPSLEVMPQEGTVGTDVYVKILNYKPNMSAVIVTFGTGTTIGAGTTVGTKTYVATKTPTDGSGYGVADFSIDIFPAGRYIIMADDGSNKITTGFKLIPSVSIGETVSGYVGDSVIVSGNGFAAKKLIYVGLDDQKLVTTETDERGQFSNARLTIPPCTRGNHNVKVQDSDNNVATAVYNVRQQVSILPAAGAVGDNVTVIGAGFEGVTDVMVFFDDKDVGIAQTGTDGGFMTVIKVPPCGDGVHRIKVDDRINRAFKDVSVSSSLSISPDVGYIGMQVGLQGSGFRPGFPMNLTYDNTKLEGTVVQPQGGFTHSFKIPVSKSGAHTVIASDGINVRKTVFTVESTPPLAPTTALPADGDRLTKDIHFEWSSVSDPSGVTYTFEVADDAKFTNIIMSQANVASNYIDITEESKMLQGKEKPYYWRVKAVDRASNEGAWSLVSSFYKGHNIYTIISSMPEWAKWILILLGLALFGFMFFWIGHTIRRLRRLNDDSLDEEEYDNGDYDYTAEANESTQR